MVTTVITELLLHSPALEEHGNDNRTPLLRAAFGGHEATVGHLLATGADPDATTRHETLLINAIDSGLTRIATTFIHQMNETALNHTIKHKLFPIVQAMFECGIGDGTSHPVVRTILRSRPEELQMLLLHGVEVKWLHDDTDMLCVACKSGQCEIIRPLLDAFGELGDDWTCVGNAELLHTADYHNHVDVVQLLIERGALVDALSKTNRETALFCAVVAGSSEHVEALLAGGFACKYSGEDATHMRNPISAI